MVDVDLDRHHSWRRQWSMGIQEGGKDRSALRQAVSIELYLYSPCQPGGSILCVYSNLTREEEERRKEGRKEMRR